MSKKPVKVYEIFFVLLLAFIVWLVFAQPGRADSPPEVMTRYDHPGPLKIGHGRTTTNTLQVWLAVDIGTWPKSENVRFNIITEDGQHIKGRAWDTGRFAGHWVETRQGNADIAFDLFCNFWLWGDDTSVIIDRWWAEPNDTWWGLL